MKGSIGANESHGRAQVAVLACCSLSPSEPRLMVSASLAKPLRCSRDWSSEALSEAKGCPSLLPSNTKTSPFTMPGMEMPAWCIRMAH